MLVAFLAAAFFCPPAQRIAADVARLRKDPSPLGFKPLPSGAAVQGVDLFESRLTPFGDKVLQVRARGGGLQSLRIAVLVPAEGGLCKLAGEDLSLDQDENDKPCENPGKLPRTLEFGKGILRVKDQSGSCADPAGSTSRLELSLYEVQGWSLKRIFATPLWDSTTQAQGRQLVQRWKVQIGEGSLRVQRCVEGGGCEEPDHFVYSRAGGKYVHK